MTERSRVVQMPLGKDRKKSQSESSRADRYHKPSLASLNPDTFVPPFDVLNELAHNKEQYVGDQYQTIYGYPSYLGTSLDRIRARVITTNKPGMLPTITCCLSYGLETLGSHPDVVSLIMLKERFDLLENVDSDLNDEVATVLRSFPLAIPDLAFSRCTKQNVALTETLKKEVYRIAGELGVSFSVVVILSLMVTLADQPSVLKDRRDMINQCLERFLIRVKIRAKLIEALLGVLGRERDE